MSGEGSSGMNVEGSNGNEGSNNTGIEQTASDNLTFRLALANGDKMTTQHPVIACRTPRSSSTQACFA